jgi:quinolinate synthase
MIRPSYIPRAPRQGASFEAPTDAAFAAAADAEIAGLDEPELLEGIERLRRRRDAVILAHNYQIPQIQDLADFVGDSLELSRRAAAADADVIAFCGVHFMAETAAILAPSKAVLIPDPDAGCSLAASITAEQLRAWKAEHPGALVVSYINTNADVKAESDYCCTSGNAEQVIESIPPDREILFVPDFFMGHWLRRRTGRPLHVWLGECHVHAGIRPENVAETWSRHPGAHLLLHPECGCISQCLLGVEEGDLPAERTFVMGTGGMVRHARSCGASADLVGTEVGMLHRLRRENPGKEFVPLREDAVCRYMKLITLPKLYRCLRDAVYRVTVEPQVAARARRAIERMVAIGP